MTTWVLRTVLSKSSLMHYTTVGSVFCDLATLSAYVPDLYSVNVVNHWHMVLKTVSVSVVLK